MAELAMEQPLPQLFSKAQEIFARVEAGGGTLAIQDAAREALELLSLCDDAVERLSLFSSNEEADDLVTSDLKYLSVPYLVAELHAMSPTLDMAARAAALERSKACHIRFLRRLRQYGVLDVNCYTALERLEAGEALDPTTTRTHKIAMFKREREVKRQLAVLTQQRMSSARAGAYVGSGSGEEEGRGGEGEGASAPADEEGEREGWLLQLDLYALKALSQVAAAEQEGQILAHGLSLPPEQQRLSPAAGGGPPPSPPLMAKLLAAAGKLDGPRAMTRRDLLKPMHQQPTRTLAKQADIEMAQAQAAADKQAAAEAARAAAGSDDEDDEEVRRQERARDDWKDDHPFGYGNSKLRPTA